jgi:hypothetical protein
MLSQILLCRSVEIAQLPHRAAHVCTQTVSLTVFSVNRGPHLDMRVLHCAALSLQFEYPATLFTEQLLLIARDHLAACCSGIKPALVLH